MRATKAKIPTTDILPGRGAYTVVYERDEDGYWIVTARDVQGCHTDGRSLANARARIREALSLWFDDAETARLDEEFVLPREVKARRAALRKARAALRHAEARFETVARDAVAALTRASFSTRDAGELLGYSQQRVAQLTTRRPPKPGRAQRRAR